MIEQKSNHKPASNFSNQQLPTQSIANSRPQSISDLRLLQDQLKREFLLLERQQREKSKIKKQIEATIQQYYTLLVEKKGLGRVITQDKLSNSYNFVKDLVLSISKDVRTGFEVLTLCDQGVAEQLCPLLLGMFYENFNENDPYLKKSTLFGEILAKKICEQLLQQNFLKKGQNVHLSLSMISPITRLILRQFCRSQALKQYFEMLANRVFNKIPHSLRYANLNLRGSVSNPDVEGVINVTFVELSQSQSICLNRSGSFHLTLHEHQIDIKIEEAVEQYKADVISKAEMMPVSMRVLVYALTKELKANEIKEEIIDKFIWEILEPEYCRPFDNSNTKKWNHFKNSYFSETVHRICQTIVKKVDSKFLDKLCDKIGAINQAKMLKKQEEGRKKISINGGCVSYRNLFFLFRVVKDNDKHLKKFNERVTNRANKILQMNPNFDFFKSFANPSTSYLVFTETLYGQTLQKDYQSRYTTVYNNNKIKNMLKQILADTTFHILPYILREKCLQDVLKKIIREQQVKGEGNFSLGQLQHSQQFLMKIKFLSFLMMNQKVDETNIFNEMVEECITRQKQNIDLFEKNKVQLLQCLTTVSKSKRIVQSQKDAERNVDYHLKIVKILDTMEINLCITSPSTRPEKEKYLKTGNKGVIVQNSTNCMHQQNIVQGLKHHASSVYEAIVIFTELKQVKQSIETGKDIYNVYEALNALIENLKEVCRNQFNVSMKEYEYFENSVFKVIMREIHEELLENKEKSPHELSFMKMLKDLSFIKPNKIRIPGRDNLAELEQVWEIVCRYLRNLGEKKNPTDKIQSIMEIIDVIKISLRKEKHEKSEKQDFADKQSIEIVLAYCLIRARPDKILSTINFIQVFLSKDKLLSREGAALQKLKSAVLMIQSKKIDQFFIFDDFSFEEELQRNATLNSVQDMKENQKAVSLIGYI